MLNLEKLEQGTVRAVRKLIGYRLSKGENGIESVYREYAFAELNEKGNLAEYPCVTVHSSISEADGGWLLDVYQSDEGYPVYVIQMAAYITVTTHGRGSHPIAVELKHQLEIASFRDIFESETGSTLVDTGHLPNNYDFLSTDYEPNTPLSFKVSIYSHYEDKSGNSSFIERVIGDGYLYRDHQDKQPIHIDFDVSSTGV